MKCFDKTIKDLLPAYIQEGLERTEKRRVEGHLESCEDCRIELSLLRMMSKESVPDPGEAFWTGMPERIYHEVRRGKQKKGFAVRNVLDGLLIHRWAWATAAVFAVATVSWFLVRPAPVGLAPSVVRENRTVQDDAVRNEPVNPAELSSAELDAATQWARNELAPLGEATDEEKMENNERDVSEELTDLGPRELDRIYELLKQKEQELKNKPGKRTDEKGAG